ncbi:putative RNA methyltransferase [Streptomyces hoynatensis]|uniref:Methyltransferase type 11 n=1 Tax=Streptomyces hoynatensis TaxID=1141874 RepID=A0A3A9Z0S9_9ACTN|nr:methyltransferase domain-containing protein [Streptomyces hoynatensis]RKN41649.1 methyltransferase type 11 [Streptomyces hoynatensis]
MREPAPRPSSHRPQPLGLLRCPVCEEPLAAADGALRCRRRHSFDIARQGYVSLLAGGQVTGEGDSADMVRARVAFLAAGHYAPLAESVAASCPPGARTVLDAGAGTGYYLAAALDALPEAVGLGLDASKFALRRAARSHPRAGAASWDVWRPLPVPDRAVDVLLNVFAPRNGPEFHRVLRPSGRLVVVTPTERHLGELRAWEGLLLRVDAEKENRLRRALAGHFTRERVTPLEYVRRLASEDVADVVLMGPAARHVTGEEVRRRVAALPTPLGVTMSFTVSVYRPLPESGSGGAR